MKCIFVKSTLIAVVLFFTAGIKPCISQNNNPTNSLNYHEFYEHLAPHGTWINYGDYGNVWSPNVDQDFRPYMTDGQWEYTDDGWYWSSDYVWGWAPFHYGTWMYDDSYGWLWEPGHEWSPANVVWGNTDDHISWAPLAPNVDANTWEPDDYYWNTVDRTNFTNSNLGNYRVDRNRMDSEASRVNIIRTASDVAQRGPDVREIGEIRGEDITPVTINYVDRMGSTHSTNRMNREVYRPTIQPMGNAEPRETRMVDPGTIRPIHENSYNPVNNYTTHRMNVNNLPVRESTINQNGVTPTIQTTPIRSTNGVTR